MADVELNSDQMSELATTVAESLFTRMNKQQQEADEAAAEKKAEEQRAADEANRNKNDGKQNEPLDMKALAAEIATQMQGATHADANKMYGVMFKEKLTAAESSIPGFGEFLEGKDDFGRVRKEQLDAIESYEDRVSALSTLSSSFKEASAGGGGRQQPTVSKKVQEKVKANEDRFKETQDKFDKGEFESVSDFTSAYMSDLQAEIESLSS